MRLTPVIRVVAGPAGEHVEGEEASQARHVIPLEMRRLSVRTVAVRGIRAHRAVAYVSAGWPFHSGGRTLYAIGHVGRYTRAVTPQEATAVAKAYVRLTQPLVRDTKGGELRPTTWDEALDRTVAGFRTANAAHGPSTFGIFSCSKATNEVNFAAQKFSRAVLGSNNIDSCNRT